MIHEDDYGFTYASDADYDRECARWVGRLRPEQAWIVSDRDVWYRNPFYEGLPQPHPDADEYHEEGDQQPYEAWTEIPY